MSAPDREDVEISDLLDAAFGKGQPSEPECERGGPCICDMNPETTDGPDIECPLHGADARREHEEEAKAQLAEDIAAWEAERFAGIRDLKAGS